MATYIYTGNFEKDQRNLTQILSLGILWIYPPFSVLFWIVCVFDVVHIYFRIPKYHIQAAHLKSQHRVS